MVVLTKGSKFDPRFNIKRVWVGFGCLGQNKGGLGKGMDRIGLGVWDYYY